MHQLSCGEIWGGTRNCDDEFVSAGLTASIYSCASDGKNGGDIYYLSLCENDSLTRIILADVLGHGEHVSQMSKMIFLAIKSHLNDASGDKLLSELNQTFLQIGLEAMTTLVMAAFYRFDGNLYFANAGHPNLLLKAKDASNWIEIKPPKGINDPALGALPEATYTQSSVQLNSGDCLMLYSDGLTEAHHKKKGYFTTSRLIELLNRYPKASASKLKQIVIDEIGQFTEGNLTHDDITIMIVNIH